MLRWLFSDAGEVLIHMPPWPDRMRRALRGLGLAVDEARLGEALRAGEEWLSSRPHQDLAPDFAAEDAHVLGHLEVVARALGIAGLDPRYLRETCYYVGACHPFADAAPGLLAVRAMGFRLGLISNAPPSLRAVLVRFDLAPLFDHLTLSSDHGIMKPDPRIYAAALEGAGASPEEAVYIDDVPANVDAARDAGFARVWLVDHDGHAPDRPDRITDLHALAPLLAAESPAAAAAGS